MRRREFLQASIAAAVAAALAASPRRGAADPPSSPAAFRKGSPRRVLVLGAGLAGLCAAFELAEAGHEVTVLEAASRAGGRVRSWRAPFADGLHGEAGAARIPASHDLTLGYARRFGLALRPFFPAEGTVYDVYDHGRIGYPIHGAPALADYPLPLTARERALGYEALGNATLGTLFERVGDPSGIDWPPPDLADIDAMTLEDYMRSQGWSNAANRMYSLGFGDREGEWWSALWLAREIMLGPTSGRDLVRIEGGNDRLPLAFAQQLAGRIHYGQEVIGIGQNEAGVRVHVRGRPEPFVADRAIVTLPFTMLRRVGFEAALPAPKRRAIETLPYASLSRVALQVRGREWLPRGAAGFARTELPSEIWLFTHASEAPRDIVQVYIKANASERLARMDADQRVAFATEHADRVFPGLARAVEGGASVCWDTEPWARGAHAAMMPGQVTTLSPHLHTIEGRLHFAGEHTSPYHGWMQGALVSARRAAREISEAA